MDNFKNELRERLKRLSDAELLDLIEHRHTEYTEDTLQLARDEAESRGGPAAMGARAQAIREAAKTPGRGFDGDSSVDRIEAAIDGERSEDGRVLPINDAERRRKIRATSVFHVIVFALFLANSLLVTYGHRLTGVFSPSETIYGLSSLNGLISLKQVSYLLLPVDVSLFMILLSCKRHLSKMSSVGYLVLSLVCLTANAVSITLIYLKLGSGHWFLPLLAYTLIYCGAIALPVIWLGPIRMDPIEPFSIEKMNWVSAVLFFPVTLVRTTTTIANKRRANAALYVTVLVVGLSVAVLAARVVQMLLVLATMIALIIIAVLVAIWLLSKIFGSESGQTHTSYSDRRPAIQARDDDYVRSAGFAPTRNRTLYDRDWKVSGHIGEDKSTVFDCDWRTVGHISDDGKTILDRDWNVIGHVSDDRRTIYDRDWNVTGHVSDDGQTIYDKDWNVSGHAPE